MLGSSLISLTLAGFAAAAPFNIRRPGARLDRRDIDCSALVEGLNEADCEHIASIGMAGMGDNAVESNGNIWIGDDGPNTFTFTNRASPSVPITLIMWDNPKGAYDSSFMNVNTPKVSYSLPFANSTVTISLENGISGGWSTLNEQLTILSPDGQIYNTWGEFTTGDSATVDISREVNMGGNIQEVTVESGCVANMDLCSFTCKDGANECGESGTYELLDCNPDTNPNASNGSYDGTNPDGGCMGWENGGHVDIALSNY